MQPQATKHDPKEGSQVGSMRRTVTVASEVPNTTPARRIGRLTPGLYGGRGESASRDLSVAHWGAQPNSAADPSAH